MSYLIPSSIAICLLITSRACATDTVRVYRGSDGTIQKVSGIVDDFDRDVLILKNGNQSRTYPAAVVLEVHTELVPSHVDGRRHFQSGKWEVAIESFELAIQRDRRGWVRQWAIRDLAIAYKMSGNIRQAATAALSLCREYPRTNQLDALPLSWTNASAPATVRRSAEQWMADARPESQLLGASWLLSGASRGKSVQVLKRLSNESEPWIAQLATAQLWRTKLVTVSTDQCRRWERLVRRLPPNLRAGPLFLLGQAWENTGDRERAATTSMRVPILHPDESFLAAAAIIQAARQMDASERDRAYQEILTHYPFTQEADVARQELDVVRRPAEKNVP